MEWFKPEHQPDAESPVEFQLKPLDLRGLYELQTAMAERGVPDWRATADIFSRQVIGWRGIGVDCTAAARAAVVNAGEGGAHGRPMMDWMVWLAQIAGRLYLRAMLSEDERKNS